MRLHKLRRTVKSVQIKEDMKERIKKNCSIAEKTMIKSEKKRTYKTAVIAAALVGCIMVSVPVMAMVQSAWQERMEQMQNQEKEKYRREFKEAKVESDSYSRPLSENEQDKIKKLREAYFNEGKFPKKELLSIAIATEVDKNLVCFLPSNSTYYLPDRELTEEEILEIIDFEQKRDYSLQEELNNANAAIDKKQKKLLQDWIQSGGLSQEDAIQIAADGINDLFGTLVSDMKIKVEYGENTETFNGRMCQKQYTVWFSEDDLSAGGVYYYIVIDAQKKEIVSASYNDFERERTQKVGRAAAKDKELYKTAQNDLKEKIGITAEIKETYLGYAGESKEGTKPFQLALAEEVSDTVNYLFVTERGRGYVLEYAYGEKKILSFCTVDDYEKEIELAAMDSTLPILYLKLN
ncbi:MAG: hypothetical protein RR364_08070 [Lachnospiraceae bacterium]